ncbi:FAD-dependent oxidoreductase [Thalassotalea euphylliae]|uniref:D-amino-acid oxidase n=1 Tax=Thalassotalea euphylliae TaxID=1655234 RepID=A0A3E0UN53_9GAMM|nr:FAD-dependent oxidoreductase [Thalassotalea euphylliae]REL37112.1 FAD-dependent oxidoreductase [Thalassotalea euphylliae]
MANIAIVGAGLLGRLMAWQLSLASNTHNNAHQISLYDKDAIDGRQSAAYTAAGLLTPYGESLSCEPEIVAMGEAALTMWPELLGELASPVDFQANGSICVSHRVDQGDYERFARHISQHYPQAQLQLLSKSEFTQQVPALAERFESGAYLQGEGCIDNHQLLNALASALQANNAVDWLAQTQVLTVSPYQVHTNSGIKQFDLVIDCRGIGASAIHTQAGSNIDANTDAKIKDQGALPMLRPVRGEVIRVYAPDVEFSLPVRLMHPRYKLYIAPKAKHEYVIGATEIESGATGKVTVQSALELLSALYSLHPGFAEAQILEQLSHCRPAFADNRPQARSKAGLIQLNGLYRHGYLLAPVMLATGLHLAAQQINTAKSSKSSYSVPPAFFEWLHVDGKNNLRAKQ